MRMTKRAMQTRKSTCVSGHSKKAPTWNRIKKSRRNFEGEKMSRLDAIAKKPAMANNTAKIKSMIRLLCFRIGPKEAIELASLDRTEV